MWIGKEFRGCGLENFCEYFDFDIGGLGWVMGDLLKLLFLFWSELLLMILLFWDWVFFIGFLVVCFWIGRFFIFWLSIFWLIDLKGMCLNLINVDFRLNVEFLYCWSWKRWGKCVRNEISSKEFKKLFFLFCYM